MKRIASAIFLTLILTTSCKADTFHMYKDDISELLQDPRTRKFKGGENDADDLSGCQVDFELGRWGISEIGREKKIVWSRHSSSIGSNSRVISSGNVYLDFSRKDNSSYITKQSNFYPIYIGPWHPITLTHTEGSFFNSKKITEQKQIRFFAYSGIGGGNIQYQYESMTEENKNIPEKEFSLSPTAKYAPDKFGLCVVKWTAKFGYNAIAEVKSKNIFSKNYLVPTGKVIEAKE
jgi:hypothetical protein